MRLCGIITELSHKNCIQSLHLYVKYRFKLVPSSPKRTKLTTMRNVRMGDKQSQKVILFQVYT